MEEKPSALSTVRAALLQITQRIRAAEGFEATSRLLRKAHDPTKFLLSLNRILRGEWLDNAVLGCSAFAGLSADTFFGRFTGGVKSIGPVSAIEVFLHGARAPPRPTPT